MRQIKPVRDVMIGALAAFVLAACHSRGHAAAAATGAASDPCALASVAQVRTLFAKVGRATARSANECDYYPSSGPWTKVAYLAIQTAPSAGQNARSLVASGAPPGALIGPIPGIGDSAAYQVTPPTPDAHLPAALVALAAVKGDRAAIITVMGPLNDFPQQAPGQAGFNKATALLAHVVAKL